MVRERIAKLQEFIKHYKKLNKYREISKPSTWGHVKSVYANAIDYNNELIIFGINSKNEYIEIKETVRAASAIWDYLGKDFSLDIKEKSVGPQSSEARARIILPDGSEH